MDPRSTQRVLVFAHGWGFDHQFFYPLLQALADANTGLFDSSLTILLDQNYYSQQQAGIWVGQGQEPYQAASLETLGTLALSHADKPWIGIGHSLGFAQLLHLSLRWAGLCSLHGFTRFVATEQNAAGTPLRILNRMIKQLATQPEEVLAQFRSRCGVDGRTEKTSINLPHLLHDLQWMTELDLEDSLNIHLQSGTQLQVLHSHSDAIVPTELTAACFDAVVSKFTAQTGCKSIETPHAGPFTTAQLYTKHLNDWIESLSPCRND